MSRVGHAAVVCILFCKTIMACGPSYDSAKFHETPSYSEMAAGHLPIKVVEHHGVYPLLVWLQLSGRYTPDHRELFHRYWMHDIPHRERDEVEDICSEDCHQLFMNTLRDHGYRVSEIKQWRLVVLKEVREGQSLNKAEWVHNCRPDAFRTAYSTFLDRKSRFGIGTAELDRWVAAQVAVFRQCATDRGDPPVDPDPQWQSIEQHDRRYQIAAWNFYRQRYLEAAERFREISESANSPWSQLARYLVPRSLARHATLNESVEWFDGRRTPSALRVSYLEKALAQFKRLSFDAAYLSEFPSVENQIMRIEGKLGYSGFVGQFERRLIESPLSIDPRDIGIWEHEASRWHVVSGRLEEYTRWLSHVVKMTASYWRHKDSDAKLVEVPKGGILQTWREELSLPYLYLALSYVNERSSRSDLRDLLTQSDGLSQDTPGYLAMLSHRIRIAGILGDEAMLDELKTEFAQLDTGIVLPALVNEVRMQFARNASDWGEYIHWASLLPVYFPVSDKFASSLPRSRFNRVTSETKLFPREATRVINVVFTPEMFLGVLDVAGLSDYQRSRLAISGWVKALLADNLELALELADWIGKYAPPLVEAMNRFKTSDDKRFEAAWIVFNHPAFSPWLRTGLGCTHLRGRPVSDRLALERRGCNWWCKRELSGWPETQPPSLPLPRFAVEMDWENLGMFDPPSATEFFGPHVIHYAEENLDDSRVPRALHRVVFATRYSCAGGPGSVSQRAYAILHENFSDSEWAKKTPYWYD